MKTLFILRGVTGSGKSTTAKQIIDGGKIFSTDEYFHKDGVYKFEFVKLHEAHLWNQLRAINAMIDGVSPIVIDNTNIRAWEAAPYVIPAKKMDYAVEVIESNTDWKFDPYQLFNKNIHGVSLETIQRMIANWQPIEEFKKELGI